MINLSKLKDPFPAEDVEWRVSQNGISDKGPWAKALAYITARAIHNRLDEVCGEDNWQLEYKPHTVTGNSVDFVPVTDSNGNEIKWPNGKPKMEKKKVEVRYVGTIAKIGIRVTHEDGTSEWIWKEGGAGSTDFESFKGSLSDSEKRAGVPWGIGRYLYKLEETFVKCSEKNIPGWNYARGKDKNGHYYNFYWEKPSLPEWALPVDQRGQGGTPAPRKQRKKKEVEDRGMIIDRFKSETINMGFNIDHVKKYVRKEYGKKGELLPDIIVNNIDKILLDMKNNPGSFSKTEDLATPVDSIIKTLSKKDCYNERAFPLHIINVYGKGKTDIHEVVSECFEQIIKDVEEKPNDFLMPF